MKKIVAFLLALVMVFVLFGCGKSEAKESDDGSITINSDTASSNQFAKDKADENIKTINENVYDADGIVITILSVERNGENDFTIRTKIINNTDNEVTGGHIISNTAYADDTNIMVWWEGPSSIPAGKNATFKNRISPNDFKEAGIDSNFHELQFEIWFKIIGVTDFVKVAATIDGQYFNSKIS